MDVNHYIEGLILKELKQEASPAELAEIQQWRQADPANEREYTALIRIWEDSLPVLRQQVFDTARAWDKVRTGLTPVHSLPGSAGNAFRRRSMTPWLAAASVLLVLAAGVWIYTGLIKQEPPRVVLADRGNQRVPLPDGSVVWLRKGASLRFPEKFRGKERLVELQGEAWFEVAHDPASTFRVKTPKALIEDIGTSFLIRDRERGEEVIVSTGKVKFSTLTHTSGKDNVELSAGEKAVLTPEGFVAGRSSDPNVIAWKTQVLEFHNTPISDVLQDIQDYYHIPLGLSPELKADSEAILLTATFHNQPVKEMLDEVKLMTGLEIRKESDTLLFFRK